MLHGCRKDSAGKFCPDKETRKGERWYSRGRKIMRSLFMNTWRRKKISLQSQPLDPIPDLTKQIAHTSFPKGTLAMHLRDALGSLYQDADFADLFPKRGRTAEAPW